MKGASNRGTTVAPGQRSKPPPMEKFLPAKPEMALMRRQFQAEDEQQQLEFSDYYSLLQIFHYLKVNDLLRAARVCRMWSDVAAHPSLWKTVQIKDGCEVSDWNGFAEVLKKRGTQHLNLRKMLDAPATFVVIRKKLVSVIKRVVSPVKLELYHCPSMTTVIELGMKRIGILESLTNLETLELGNCFNVPKEFGTRMLPKLQNLKRLRLEKITHTSEILEGVSKLENLSQLELVYFNVTNGFDKCLANCKNIKKLLIIPSKLIESPATSNNMGFGGVMKLSNNLTHFVWGFTSMKMREPDYYLSEEVNEQITDDSLPIWGTSAFLKLIEDIEGIDISKGDDKVLQLQKILLTALPKTRAKVLIIPFDDMWRHIILYQKINEVIAKEFKEANNAR